MNVIKWCPGNKIWLHKVIEKGPKVLNSPQEFFLFCGHKVKHTKAHRRQGSEFLKCRICSEKGLLVPYL